MKYNILYTLVFFIAYDNANAQANIFQPVAEIYIKENLGLDKCNNCIKILSSATEPEKFIYLNFNTNNSLLKYNIEEKKIIKSIKYSVEKANTTTPFYVDSLERIYAFATLGVHNAIAVFQNYNALSLYTLDSFFVNDSYNNLYLGVSSFVNNEGWIALNIMRDYFQKTASSYYSQLSRTPVIGIAKISDGKIAFFDIPYFTQLAETDSQLLVSRLHLFDIDKPNSRIFFQHRCSNDIYCYDFRKAKLSCLKVRNSKYQIFTYYYNPLNTQKEDVLLKQVLVGSFYYSAANKSFYRQLSIPLATGSKFLLQKINNDGKVIKEVFQPANYKSVFRLKNELYISSIDSDKISLFKILL